MIYSTGNLPIITKHPISTHVELMNNFSSVTFTCKAQRALSYYWSRRYGNISSYAVGINTSNLRIVKLRLKDAGHYRCVAINNDGSTASKYATLTFKGMYVRIIYAILACVKVGLFILWIYVGKHQEDRKYCFIYN